MNVPRLVGLVYVAAAILVISGARGVFAQGDTRGRIQSRVLVDGTREPVVGAVVRAVLPASPETGRSVQLAEAVTDDNGLFAIAWIRSGRWQVTASVEGFGDVARYVQVSQSRSYACVAGELRCRGPVEFSMVKLPDPMHPPEAPSTGALAGILADDLQADLDTADGLFDGGDYDSAIAAYEAVLNQVPLLTSLHLQIGHAYRAKRDYERALLAYRAVPAQTAAWTEAEAAIQDLETLGAGR